MLLGRLGAGAGRDARSRYREAEDPDPERVQRAHASRLLSSRPVLPPWPARPMVLPRGVVCPRAPADRSRVRGWGRRSEPRGSPHERHRPQGRGRGRDTRGAPSAP